MIITDKIYGKIEVNEPILLKLLKSPSLLRLQKISQYGIPDKYYHFKNFSRYEHSLGVMILLKRLGATLEEQVAGFLHDVSTLAFSHVTDWVFSNGSKGIENYHNQLHKKFFKNTEIPKILKKFNFSVKRILNEKNFTLLEKGIPDLCADRVDYALREFKYWLNPKIVKNCLKGLVNFNGEITFSNPKIAFDFASHYLQLQNQHWGEYEAIMRYSLFSKTLKKALAKKIISKKDFYKDEEFILNKLEKTKDKEIKKILTLLKRKKLKAIKRDSGKKVFKKFRYVDPKVLINGNLIRLTKLKPEFQKTINKYKQISKKGLTITGA